MLKILTSNEFLNHDTGSHPESIDRYRTIKKLFKDKFNHHTQYSNRLAKLEDLKLCHEENYINHILDNIPSSDFYYYDPDTKACPKSLNSYLNAVGICLDAIDKIFTTKNPIDVFCGVRPPGHHAETNKAMGFGVFNNIAIAARYAISKYKVNKILIVDFDVHHGNGTQEIFFNDSRVSYASSHQFPFYPGTGSLEEIGKNNIFNCPLPGETKSDTFRNLFSKNIIDKITESFDLIMFSAGFDAHYSDPLASINLTEEDFYWATTEICDKFANDKSVLSVLEGGYNMDGLYNSLNSHLNALIDFRSKRV